MINFYTQSFPEIKKGQEIEVETEHGQTFYKVETDDDKGRGRGSDDSGIEG
ncbi:hypothetical protein [Bacillus sp. OK048]|uniref:hypothetical protein n=1 Tax=Bacillus sp. OK048 TaxID=1882761 RepID=UPI001587494B|nr:hypothetical protein [Bacillus sp. OK048]